ncbi:F-box associated interaction domain [Arabidopsis thaliana x Arabidopsis arenosa]|uniref:F-box associated interaction domain n=1 Tax=Arabidopsis thaliana x Arabidopsis arenosa TaxID=1240361 RepID=A0A8T1XRW7_9BRAS|nr:F-box associated interaction domain [Arabidopsis thaliana x Arabidopsis arenosa]
MITEDLLVEILLRVPVKTLARCLCVSKLLATIIRSRHFINLYQSRSSTRQQHVMFALRDIFTFRRWHFFLSSQPSLVTNAICCVDNTSLTPDCVNGLICLEDMHRLWIYNPATRKGVLLPQSAPYKPFRKWYMGYDPINCQYKVLFFSKEKLVCPYKVEVFTLGGQGSWKKIEVENNHSPATRGVCIDGVVYYGSHTAHGLRLERFYVATEKFGNFIEIPVEASKFYGFFTFVNYQGKLALLVSKNINMYDLWVLEDAGKQEWSKVSIVLPRELFSYDLVWLELVGFVAGSGELIVTARDQSFHLYLVYVDLKMKRSNTVWLGGIRCSYRPSLLVLTFTDYVESIMFL